MKVKHGDKFPEHDAIIQKFYETLESFSSQPWEEDLARLGAMAQFEVIICGSVTPETRAEIGRIKQEQREREEISRRVAEEQHMMEEATRREAEERAAEEERRRAKEAAKEAARLEQEEENRIFLEECEARLRAPSTPYTSTRKYRSSA